MAALRWADLILVAVVNPYIMVLATAAGIMGADTGLQITTSHPISDGRHRHGNLLHRALPASAMDFHRRRLRPTTRMTMGETCLATDCLAMSVVGLIHIHPEDTTATAHHRLVPTGAMGPMGIETAKGK